MAFALSRSSRFLSTPSARRATRRAVSRHHHAAISIHALREEGDSWRLNPKTAGERFLSTPSARRATGCEDSFGLLRGISIHALREEGDGGRCGCIRLILTFLSTPSARRATAARILSVSCVGFLSTPSARRATARREPLKGAANISIHALREEGDDNVAKMETDFDEFLSTPSARRATPTVQRAGCVASISIHALREEGDASSTPIPRGAINFYPRPPRGGRHDITTAGLIVLAFLSTPSARRATYAIVDILL